MARVTVEDCIPRRLASRFKLVLYAAHRAREISAGAELTVPRDNDKNPVVALREIAEGTVSVGTLQDSVIQAYCQHQELDETEQEMADMLSEERNLSGHFTEIGSSKEESLTFDEDDDDSSEEEGGEELEELSAVEEETPAAPKKKKGLSKKLSS